MDLTHFQDGRPRMVDVTEKPETFRTATAEAFVELTEEALSALEKGGVGKGDPLKHWACAISPHFTRQWTPHSTSLNWAPLLWNWLITI